MEGKKREEARQRFEEVYHVLKSELLNDPAFDYDPVSRHWINQMLDYTVPGGKMSRGLAVVETLRLLKDPDNELTPTEFFLSSVLGWCLQWLVGCVLVLDDIMDHSYTRRGRPCWHTLPKVGMIAVNDGTLLWNHIYRILKKHFRDQPYYAHLLDLFTEVIFQTASGQILDLISTLEGEKDLLKYSSHLQRRSSQFKTAYGTFYLPIFHSTISMHFGYALLMLGKKLDDYIDVKDILLEMGIYFQVQDDYLDCYGDPEKVGKIGTDIQDFKCSWLVVKALELCDEEQKKVLCDNYGKPDSANIAIVKSLYNDLNLQGTYAEYEIEIYEKLRGRIESVPSKPVQAVLRSYLEKIYKRQK